MLIVYFPSNFDVDNSVDKLKSYTQVKIEIVVTDDIVDTCVDTIIRTAQTGKIGDGKIFISPVSRVIKVRTGEEDREALL